MARSPSHRRRPETCAGPWLAVIGVLLVACGGDPVAQAPTRPSSVSTSPSPADDAVPTSVLESNSTTTTLPTTTLPTTTPPTTSAPSDPTTSLLEDPMTSTPEPPLPDSPVPDDVIAGTIVQAAIDDLVARTGADRAAIEVVSVVEVDWPDGSIGCPQPGMVYTQAIVNGSKIVLRYDDTDYAYHQGGSRPVFYCPSSATVEK